MGTHGSMCLLVGVPGPLLAVEKRLSSSESRSWLKMAPSYVLYGQTRLVQNTNLDHEFVFRPGCDQAAE
eukprot:SAG22_NODE_79_length_21845_cov_17.798538_7_plen_69_part_00